jgi:hypothetical protein
VSRSGGGSVVLVDEAAEAVVATVKGANTCVALFAGRVGRIGAVTFSFVYVAFRALLGALVRSRRGLDVKDIELLVVRVGYANSIVSRARTWSASPPASVESRGSGPFE